MLRSLSIAPGPMLAAGLALFVAACGLPILPGSNPLAPQTSPTLAPLGDVDPSKPVLVALLVPLTAADASASVGEVRGAHNVQ